jgi:hypothetical protein
VVWLCVASSEAQTIASVGFDDAMLVAGLASCVHTSACATQSTVGALIEHPVHVDMIAFP